MVDCALPIFGHKYSKFPFYNLFLLLSTFCSTTILSNAFASHSSTTPSDLKSRARLALQLERSNTFPCDATIRQQLTCPPSKYRSPTGECNNINNRSWGARGDIFLRLLEPSYADGRIQPRTSIGPHALPASESIVDAMQKSIDDSIQHPHITAMLPAWGQLLSYDLVEITSLTTNFQCCRNQTRKGGASSEEMDQCYVRAGSQCREYKRSVPSTQPGVCSFEYRNQMNAASGYIDGSGLYGSTEKDFQSLRTYRSGKVDIRACPRCTESGAVGALHTILLKEHNRIAIILADKNPSWSDSTLFLESRRAVMAVIQHITYNEFLPIILGQQIANKESLK